MQPKHPLHCRQPVTMSLRVCVSSHAAGRSTHHRPKTGKSCATTQVSVSTLPSIKSHEFYFELFAQRKSEWLSGRMASRLATSASYGIIGCLGGGHDKENERHARENTLVRSMSLTGKAAANLWE